ncbi:MAG TPA: carboxypeptidase-like regulatory domain-containing protein [Polyangia bacterium]|jgi:membrane protein implicated in regulation of membrane protease activity|nr:carboxypeptidase-like regulatory domain-containing protein [Polyangia bacterium]
MRAFLLGLGLLVTAMVGVGHGQEASLHVLARARIQWTGAEWREEGLVVSGRLIDEATGEGLAGRKVQLRAQGPAGEEVQQATSDAQGAFRLKWRLPLGEYRLRAEFPGDTDCQAAAPQDWEVSERRSGPGRGQGEGQMSPGAAPERPGGGPQEGAEAAAAAPASEGAPAEPEASVIPLTWYLAPLLFTSLLLLCAWFVWSAPWRRLRRSSERRAPGEARRLVKKEGVVPDASPLPQNVRDGGLTGVVWDAVLDEPVAGAEIRVQALAQVGPGAQDERLLTSDAVGRFQAEDLAPGAYALRVTALGYLEERLECTLPARGSARDVRVGMTPIRAVVLGLFRETVALPESPTRALGAEEELPESEPEARTPRELAAGVGEALTAAQERSLAQLTLLVEETYFSSRIAAPEVVSEARYLAEQVKGAPQAPRTTT